ncbi:hypothetical protein PHLCEN_2v6553 [Hermanssonia centrifuga]|uniref:Protein kinase domain-containing protein n=1 Tax=Hermanssonia centrifuga TaxID=98765 RepID=A0A2R6NZ24_9APHY|nr:hypothetical protein PHLCEN_2v6553 [Hermanssonia centrifuga]
MPILPFKFLRLRLKGRSHVPIHQDQYVENAVFPRSPVVTDCIHPELDRKFDLTSSVRCADRSPIVYGYHADLWKGIWNGEVVAIKVIRVIGNSVDRKQACAKNALKEVEIWSSVKHKNVLPLYGYSHEFGPVPSLVSPYMNDGTASLYLKTHPDVNRLQICAEISNGLAYLHEQRIVHGDLKGDNVLICSLEDRPYPLICDFGLSKRLDLTGSLRSTIVKGTVPWMAKELLMPGTTEDEEAACTLTFQSDVWAWGMTTYELFTDAPPYSHLKYRTLFELSMHIADGNVPEYPVSCEQSLEQHVWALLQMCWNPDPSQRPRSDELRLLVRGQVPVNPTV